MRKTIALLFALAACLAAQETVDHRNAQQTFPVRVSQSTPGTCTPYEWYTNTTNNLTYPCTAPNVWGNPFGASNVVTQLTAPTSSISTAETAILAYSVPANALNVGTTYGIHFSATVNDASTPSGTLTYNVRFGTTTPPSGNIVATLPITLSTTVSSLSATLGVDCYVTVITTGSSGTAGGWCNGYGAGGGYSNVTTSNVTIDTTQIQNLQVTGVLSAGGPTTTVYAGYAALVKQ
jgi:hypothetical protein